MDAEGVAVLPLLEEATVVGVHMMLNEDSESKYMVQMESGDTEYFSKDGLKEAIEGGLKVDRLREA